MQPTHLEDHGQQVHRQLVQVHRAPTVQFFLQLLAGLLAGSFPEYPFGRRAFKAEDGEDVLREQKTLRSKHGNLSLGSCYRRAFPHKLLRPVLPKTPLIFFLRGGKL